MTTPEILTRLTQKPQPLTFADYMDCVLYDPDYGYYAQNQTAIGSTGDFFTSVSLGADLGELLAVQFAQMWEVLGQPDPFHLVEMGAGDGHLAADILSFLQTNFPDCAPKTQYIIVERAAGKRTQQRQTLGDRENVQWQTWEEIEPASLQGCCFANELVDAFPIHRVVVQGGQLQEIYVTAQEGQLQEVVGDLSTERIATYFADLGLDVTPPTYPEGYRTEVNLAALDWLKTVASRLKLGYLLTIDYGYGSDRYYSPQRTEGTLQAYYQHRHHHNPYVNLGQQDLTAHVNFTALEHYGEAAGLNKLGFTQQGLFLMALGLGDRLQALSNGQHDIQTIFKRRDALHQLIDPAGLGNFGVLVQSKGLLSKQQAMILKGLEKPSLI